MMYIIKINVKYVFLRNYQAHKLLKDILYIPGWLTYLERINLTDDLQLPSNFTNVTRVNLQGQNIYDIL